MSDRWRRWDEYDRQLTPRRSARAAVMIALLGPAVIGLMAAGLAHGTGSISANFLSTTAQVLPTLMLALAIQVGIVYTRFAGPLRSTRGQPGGGDVRFLYVTRAGPIPKIQTSALLSILVVFGLLIYGEARTLLVLARCGVGQCRLLARDVDAVAGAYAAGMSLMAVLLVVDLIPRLAQLPWGEPEAVARDDVPPAPTG